MRKKTKKESALLETKKSLITKPKLIKSLSDDEVNNILSNRNNPTFNFNIGYKIPKPYLRGKKENILCIGDTHFPFEREGYLEFNREIQEKFQCGTVIHMGDEVDNHAISYHETDPDGFSAGNEGDLAQAKLNIWYKVFPKVDVIVGNHSALPFRQAMSIGLPKRFMKAYEEIWNAPKSWKWHLELELYNTYFVHGTGSSGDDAALKRALHRRQSVVQGHIHTAANLKYNVSHSDCIWGMQVGCGIDDKSYASAYARTNIKKSIISSGVVLDKGRMPIVVPMSL